MTIVIKIVLIKFVADTNTIILITEVIKLAIVVIDLIDKHKSK